MGITENYRFVKRPCSVCSETGIVMVPENVSDLYIYFHDQCFLVDRRPRTHEELCPICDGLGYYYHELED